MKPKVSVLMPVYNPGAFLKEAVESILSQTFRDFEFIIINDGSTDDSQQLLESYNDPRIRIIKNEKNIGIIASRNKGIQLAQGIYIANMDSDDSSMPTRLEKQVKFLEQHPEVAALATKLLLINENDEEIGIWPEDYYCTTRQHIKQTLPIINCIGQPSVMMKTSVVKRIGYQQFIHNEDWGLWLELLSEGEQIDKLDEFLLKYRVHSSSTTVTSNTKGVEKKIIRFKFSYLKNKIKRRNLKGTDYKVLTSFFRDMLKFSLKTIVPGYKLFVKLVRIKFFKLLKQFWKVRMALSALEKQVSNIFIFPFYHTGGAEKVHASILEALNQKKSITFITGKSEGDAFLKRFQEFSTVIEINYLLDLGFTERWLLKKISSFCSATPSVTLLGCNSPFFYDLIPSLPAQVKVVDLIHAFVHVHEQGPEKWSLPLVSRIDKRIVINEKTKNDFRRFYKLHHVDENYVSRIVCIPNFVEHGAFVKKTESDILKILYVGRGTPEKRVYLIAEIAAELKKNDVNVEFHFAGNVKEAIPEEYLSCCILHGEITNEKEMESLYAQSQMLIVTSSREGFPMVIMEAMAQGVVPVSTDVGGISEHLKHKNNGILISVSNESEIVDQFVKTITYYNKQKNELAEMSVNAYKYAVEHFNKENFFRDYLTILKN